MIRDSLNKVGLTQMALGSDQLLRYLPSSLRLKYYNEKINGLRNNDQNTSDSVIIIMEFIENLRWKFICIVGPKKQPISIITNHMRKYIGESVFICTPKNKSMINLSRKIEEIYKDFHDRDDNMLYLMALTQNPYGSENMLSLEQ